MRSFTSYLNKSVRPQWKDYYLDYLSLKNLLEKFADRRTKINDKTDISHIERFYFVAEASKSFEISTSHDFNLMTNSVASDDCDNLTTKNSSVKDYVAKIERDEFCFVLDREVKKIAELYRRQLQDLQSDITLLDNEIIEATAGGSAIEEDGGLLQTFVEKYKAIGSEVLELHAFVGVNITALRQILIRFDSLIRTLDGPPIGEWYIVTRREVHVNNDFESIFVRHGLLLLTDTFIFAMRNLQSMKIFINDNNGDVMNEDIDDYLANMSNDINKMEMVIARAERSVDKALRSRLGLTDSLFFSLRYYFLAGSVMNELVMQPSFIRSRGLKLLEEIRFFSKWRTSHTQPTEIAVSTENSKGDIRALLHPSLILNFTSQFLYMMNHYIIEPSSTQYVHALGGKDALSGLLIGMTPWAGLIAGFVYSYWSNHSFRSPLLCSGIFLTLGSFLYANALQFQSLTMAMIGRFLTGLGAPCGLNVRFIADTVIKTNRTAISAILVTVSAMGMSLGPFCAVLLDFYDIEIQIPYCGELLINGMTGPGFLMFILWGIYLVLLFIYFEDRERIGLHEIAFAETPTKYSAPSLDQVDQSKSGESLDTSEFTYYSDDDDENLEEIGQKKDSAMTKIRYINEATVVCMVIKFIGKFVLEIMGCSVSLITRHRYDWTVKNIGTLSFVNGLLVIPISTSVGFLSQYYTDITLLLWLLGVAITGLLLLLDVTDFVNVPEEDDGYNDGEFLAVAPWRYVTGIVLEFCGLQAAQSVVLSMLSKVVPLSLAKGTFNSGFMATTLSTLARANGDMLITVMGLVSLRQLLNLLVVPCILMTGFSLMISYFHKHKLSV